MNPDLWVLDQDVPIPTEASKHTLLDKLETYVTRKLKCRIFPNLKPNSKIFVASVHHTHISEYCASKGWKVEERDTRTEEREKSKTLGLVGPVQKYYNVIRPTHCKIQIEGDPHLLIAVPPGRDYLKHFAQMIRFSCRGVNLTVEVLYHPNACGYFYILGYENLLVRTATVPSCFLDVSSLLFAYEYFYKHLDGVRSVEPRTLFQGSGNFGLNVLTYHGVNLLFLGVKIPFWGDVAGLLAEELYKMGATTVLYLAKLGTLTNPDDILRDVFVPKEFYLMQKGGAPGRAIGVRNCLHSGEWLEAIENTISVAGHLSVPTIMDETKAAADHWRRTHSLQTVDNEIAYMAMAARKMKRFFGAAHYATDYLNVWQKDAATSLSMLNADSPERAEDKRKVPEKMCSLAKRFVQSYRGGVVI